MSKLSAYKSSVASSALLITALVAAPAVAQDTGLETVTVTARYSTENLQTTPLAITAITADKLTTAGISSVSSLGSVVPNLYTHPGDADEGGTPVMVMRGVSESDASFAREPAIALFVDDVYHATMVGVDMGMNDIDHIEVKRGPQGTLGGNASIGGSIAIYTKTPKGDNTGEIAFTFGSYNKQEISASYDFSITDNFFGRISGGHETQDGFFKELDFTCEMNALGTPQLAGTWPENPVAAFAHGCVNDHAGGTNHANTKLQLRYVPSSTVEMNFSASYFKTDDETAPEGNLYIVNSYPGYLNNSNFTATPSALVVAMNNWLLNNYGVVFDNRMLPPPGMKYAAYSSFCRANYNGPTIQTSGFPPVPFGFCFPNKQGMNSTDVSFKIDWDVSDKVHSKSIFAFDKYEDLVFQDGSYDPFGYDLFNVQQPVQQASIEERLSGTAFDDKLSWVGGAFGLASKGISEGFVGYLADDWNNNDVAYKETASVFLHGEYKITDAWSISGGGRYTYNKLKYHFDHPQLQVTNGVPYTVTPFSIHEYHFDWLASTNYQVTDDIMAYGSVSTGSRPPGITTIVNTAAQLSGYPAEELTAYEVGLKTEWFDHRLRVNADGFYSDYARRLVGQSGFQCLGQPGTPTWYATAASCAQYANTSSVAWSITTARPATVKGVELETTAEPIDGLLLTYDAGYNTFESSVKTAGLPGYIHPGDLIQPNWNMSASIQYTFDGLGGAWTPNLNWNYTSALKTGSNTAVAADYMHTTPAQNLFNFSLDYVPTDSKWKLSLQVQNLTNLYYFYQPFQGNPNSIASQFGPPREVFIVAKRTF